MQRNGRIIISVSIELVREQTSKCVVMILRIKEHRIRGVKKASWCVDMRT